MIRTFLTSAAALIALSTVTAASAQDAEAEAEAVVEAEASDEEVAEEEAPEVRRVYPPIEYDASEDPENVWVLDLSNGERIKIRLMDEWAPGHVERIKTLTREGFYNGIVFHRVLEGFMAQGGDPTATGTGGSELPDLKAEFNPMPHVRGTVSMARSPSGDDTANSQFFIVFYPRFNLDKRYTNFGRVIENMAAVDAINRGEPPPQPTRILQASMAADNLPPPEPQAPQVAPDITADLLSAPLEQQ